MHVSEYTERELLGKLREGSVKAFDQLYELHHYNLLGHLLVLLKSRELAKEVAQDTFMTLWEQRANIREESSIKPYLFKIASNLTFNIFKKASYDDRYRSYMYPIIESGYAHIEEDMMTKERRHLLNAILDKMPMQQREVFIRCKVEGKSYAEVGSELNLSPHTIHTHLKRANQFIKQYLIDYPEYVGLILLSVYFNTGTF